MVFKTLLVCGALLTTQAAFSAETKRDIAGVRLGMTPDEVNAFLMRECKERHLEPCEQQEAFPGPLTAIYGNIDGVTRAYAVKYRFVTSDSPDVAVNKVMTDFNLPSVSLAPHERVNRSFHLDQNVDLNIWLDSPGGAKNPYSAFYVVIVDNAMKKLSDENYQKMIRSSAPTPKL